MINITKTSYNGVDSIDVTGKVFDLVTITFQGSNSDVCGDVTLPFGKFTQYYNNDIDCDVIYDNTTNTIYSLGDYNINSLTEILGDNREIKTFGYDVKDLVVDYDSLYTPGIVYVLHKDYENSSLYKTTILNSSLIKTVIGLNHVLEFDSKNKQIRITKTDVNGPDLFVLDIGYLW